MNKKSVEYIKKYLPESEIEEGLKLLEKGIAPQYIVGNVDFYGNFIKVNANVLIPRFETELLVEKSINYINKNFGVDCSNLEILDIGTGSGCIAITLKKELCCMVTACDISIGALEVAKENALKNEVDISIIHSDVFSKVDDKFDVIISNPPYIREDEEIEDIVRNNEPHSALYASDNGLYFYDKILKECSIYLKDKFLICFEIGESQALDIVKMAHKYLKDVIVSVEKDYSNRDRFIFISKN